MENNLANSSDKSSQIDSLQQAAEAIYQVAAQQDIKGVLSQEIASSLSTRQLTAAQSAALEKMKRENIWPSAELHRIFFWVVTIILAGTALDGMVKSSTDKSKVLMDFAIQQFGVVAITEVRKKIEEAKDNQVRAVVNSAIVGEAALAVVNGEVTAANLVNRQPTQSKLDELRQANDDYQQALLELPGLEQIYQEKLTKYEAEVLIHDQKADQAIASIDLAQLQNQIKSVAGVDNVLITSDIAVDTKRVLTITLNFESPQSNFYEKKEALNDSLGQLNNNSYLMDAKYTASDNKLILTLSIKPNKYQKQKPIEPSQPKLEHFLPKFKVDSTLSHFFPTV